MGDDEHSAAKPQQKAITPPSPPRRCEKIDLGLLTVIPAKAGIQYFRGLTNYLDPGFHRGDS